LGGDLGSPFRLISSLALALNYGRRGLIESAFCVPNLHQPSCLSFGAAGCNFVWAEAKEDLTFISLKVLQYA
jgi:hypothetical protein